MGKEAAGDCERPAAWSDYARPRLGKPRRGSSSIARSVAAVVVTEPRSRWNDGACPEPARRLREPQRQSNWNGRGLVPGAQSAGTLAMRKLQARRPAALGNHLERIAA